MSLPDLIVFSIRLSGDISVACSENVNIWESKVSS